MEKIITFLLNLIFSTWSWRNLKTVNWNMGTNATKSNMRTRNITRHFKSMGKSTVKDVFTSRGFRNVTTHITSLCKTCVFKYTFTRTQNGHVRNNSKNISHSFVPVWHSDVQRQTSSKGWQGQFVENWLGREHTCCLSVDPKQRVTWRKLEDKSE